MYDILHILKENVYKFLFLAYLYGIMYFVHVYIKRFYFTYCCANIFQIFFVNNSTLCIIVKRLLDIMENIMFGALNKILTF